MTDKTESQIAELRAETMRAAKPMSLPAILLCVCGVMVMFWLAKVLIG